jgi:hypothetical protein
MLKEKGWGAIMKDILSLTAHNPTLATIAKTLVAVLRLSSSALMGKTLIIATAGLPERNRRGSFLRTLREEANFFKAGPWLKTLKSMLMMTGSYEMTMMDRKDSGSIFPDGRIVSGSMDRTVRI